MDTRLTSTSYRDVLKNELKLRIQKNPSYTLRSFALRLKMQASALSEILNGKRGLSPNRAGQVADALGFQNWERQYFVSLVESMHARSKPVRDLALQKIANYQEILESPLNEDQAEVISNWWHFAIIELSRTQGFVPTPRGIARKLGIPSGTAKEAVERLIRMKVLRKSGKTIVPVTDALITSGHDVPSEAIRNLHRELIKKSLVAIDSQDTRKRNLSSLVFSIDTTNEKTVDQLKKLIMDFNKKINKIATASNQATELYCFSTQLFSLEAQNSTSLK